MNKPVHPPLPGNNLVENKTVLAQERTYYKPMVDGAALEGLLLVRIADGSMGKKPFDMFGLSNNGVSIAIEVKKVESLVGSPIKLLEKHQHNYLKEWERRGGLALIAVHIAILKQIAIYRVDKASPVCFLFKNNSTWRGWSQVKTMAEQKAIDNSTRIITNRTTA